MTGWTSILRTIDGRKLETRTGNSTSAEAALAELIAAVSAVAAAADGSAATVAGYLDDEWIGAMSPGADTAAHARLDRIHRSGLAWIARQPST